MNSNKSSLSIIKKLINFLERLSDSDLEKINSNEATVKFEFIDLLSRKKNKNLKVSQINYKRTLFTTSATKNVDTIVSELNSLKNREDGFIYLKNTVSSRPEIESILKKLDIPYKKRDNISSLTNKVIEGTIGFRLTSQAIQSTTNEKKLE